MNLIYKPQGYTNSQQTHQNPVSHTPPVKTLHDKKDTTLLQMAMKAFLKERIYGRIQNFNKNNISNKNHLTSRESLVKGHQSNPHIYSSLQHYQKSIKSSNQKKLLSISTHQHDAISKIQISQLNEMKRKQYIKQGQMSILNKRRNNQSKTARYSQSNKQSHIMTSRAGKQRQYQDISFISAVNIQHLQSKKQLKLPDINNKKKVDKQKDKNIIIKIDVKKTLTMDDQLWSFLCEKNIAKQFKKSTTKNNDLNNSIASIHTQKLSIKQLDMKINIKNTNLLSKSLLDKQTFLVFTKNTQFNIPQFFVTVFSFFELGNKIIDKMKRVDFDNLINSLIMMNRRAWAVVIFRYLDQNHDGKIDSSDLFKIYNYLDEILNKNQELIRTKQQIRHSEITHENEYNIQAYQQTNKQNNQSPNRQKTQISQKSNISKTLSTKNRRISHTQKPREVSAISLLNASPQPQNEQTLLFINFAKHNISIIKTLKQQIQKLNIIILQFYKQSSKQDHYDYYNPENQSQLPNSPNSSNKSPYLQQILLTKQQLKYTDMNLILSLTQKSSDSRQNKNVIDIDKKKLNVKLSSMYVQTFSATDHNQETRGNREYIENLKECMKKKCQNNISQVNYGKKKMLTLIQYQRFFEHQLYLPFKQIFFSLLHMQVYQNDKLT